MAMDSRSKVLGHALHQVFVVFPLGLLSTSVVFDGLHLATGKRAYAGTARAMIGAGLLGGAAAAVPGVIDWLAIPGGTRARGVERAHGLGNVGVLGLFAASYSLRDGKETPSAGALALSFARGALAMGTAWLGGELVARLGVGVSPGAHLDAPSPLEVDKIPAPERTRALVDEAA